MLTLFTFPPAFGQPSASSFSTKAIYLMNLSGQPFERKNLSDPRKFPRSKLPALETPEGLIGDSDNIRTYLETKGADFDKGLSDEDKSTSRALIRMAEEHLYFHGFYDRWGNEDVWPHVRDMFFGEIPAILRPLITGLLRRGALRSLHGQGVGRFNDTERLARAEPDLQAIATRLATRDYLFGDTPTAADASVASVIGALGAQPVPTLLSERVTQDPILSAYAERAHTAMSEPSAGSG